MIERVRVRNSLFSKPWPSARGSSKIAISSWTPPIRTMSMSMIAPSIATSSGYDANSGRLILNSMQSTRSMEPDTVSPTNRESDHSPRWSGRFSLTRRILAVNILALVLLAGGFFYLDSYRTRVVDARLERTGRELKLLAVSLDRAARQDRESTRLNSSH